MTPPGLRPEGLVSTGQEDLGASPADAADRAGGLRPEPTASSQPSGRSSTGAGDWQVALKRCFDTPGFLDLMARNIRSGGFPMLDGEMVSWSDWLISNMLAAGAAKASPWQPIETAPKDGTAILVFIPRQRLSASSGSYWCEQQRVVSWDRREGWQISPKPSHWMPLPAAPCDNGSDRNSEDSRSEAEGEASQSGAAKTAHRPETSTRPNLPESQS